MKDLFALKDLLSLVDENVSIHFLKSLSPKKREVIEKWAYATHLRASDYYDVKIPKKPKELKSV